MGGGFGAVRARSLPAAPHTQHTPHTPLRHAHVTSTTHPHHLHGMSEMNLRGLLSPASRALAAAHARPPLHAAPHAAAMHAYQQSECRDRAAPPRPARPARAHPALRPCPQ